MGECFRVKNLFFGIGTELLLHIGGVEARLRSTLVGVKPDEYLIIETPRVSGIESKLFDGNGVTVIFMCSGTIYGFKASILNSIRNPSRLIFISYPESVEHHELRGSHRVECHFPATLALEGDDGEYEGILIDLSRGGCRYTTVAVPRKKTHLFQLESKVKLTFELLGIEGRKAFSGEIKNLSIEDRRLSIGVKFQDENGETLKRIEEYVESVMDFFS